jgi:UDP-glucose 4-epimerase
MKIEGSKILVTGGAGLIGSTTIDQLLANEKPAEIVILDNMSRGSTRNLENALKDERVKLIQGDIRDKDLVYKVTEGMDAVIHMAAIRITACAADPREAMEVMNDGTFNVIDAAHKAGVKKVLAASSASILGLADSFPTKEDHHPYNNRTWYGASKIMLEGLLRSYNDMYGLNYVAMRYFNVYGPRMDVEGKYTEVLVRWVQRINQGIPPLDSGRWQDVDGLHLHRGSRPRERARPEVRRHRRSLPHRLGRRDLAERVGVHDYESHGRAGRHGSRIRPRAQSERGLAPSLLHRESRAPAGLQG